MIRKYRAKRQHRRQQQERHTILNHLTNPDNINRHHTFTSIWNNTNVPAEGINREVGRLVACGILQRLDTLNDHGEPVYYLTGSGYFICTVELAGAHI